MNLPAQYKHEHFVDNLLVEHLGATDVESFDNSNYEGANHIEDLSKPLSKEYNRYDTVIDFGCLEHIYNIPQAFKNVSELCREGGQILHKLPANNLCGHGFWQFSPELFFSLYSEENGYSGTQVFLTDGAREDIWYEVTKPHDGQRIELNCLARLDVLCRTRKVAKISHDRVQQSDYVYVWDKNSAGNVAAEETPDPPQNKSRRPVRRGSLSRMVNLARYVRANLKGDLSIRGNPRDITKRPISTLV